MEFLVDFFFDFIFDFVFEGGIEIPKTGKSVNGSGIL